MNQPTSTGDPDDDLPVPERTPDGAPGGGEPAGTPQVETGPAADDYEPL